MTTSYVTANLYTNRGESHIFSVAATDGQLNTLTDIITSQGLGSLQGQTIVKAMLFQDGAIYQGNGCLFINAQNIPVASLPVARIEKDGGVEWQNVNIGPIDLNWSCQVYPTAAPA